MFDEIVQAHAGEAMRRRTSPVPSHKAVVFALAVSVASGPTLAEDTVYVYLSAGTAAPVRFTGDIQDYNGKELVIRTSSDTRTFESRQVAAVETERVPPHQAAEQQFTAGKFRTALPQFQQALQTEQRRWMRREILARIVQCHHAVGDPLAAGGFFLALLGDDAFILHLDCIPLAWWPEQPTVALEQKAQEWLNSTSPAVALLGASHLLTTQRTAAAEKLSQLRLDKDPRIAALARAQSWRAATTFTDQTLQEWQDDLQRMPSEFRYGGYYLLGLAAARGSRPDQAALYYLRVPIMYPRQGALAAKALVEAAHSLQTGGQRKEADRLLREVRERFSETRAAAELAAPSFRLDGKTPRVP